MNIVEKILSKHLVKGKLIPGETISLKVDQVLTQDATGTLVYLQFEALKSKKIKIPLAVSYVDHNILQIDSRNADDHIYLQTAAAKYGAYFSKPGNGICHQVHLERFVKPGVVLLGSDSHTPTAGGIGALGIGVGGTDIAISLAGVPFKIKMPDVVLIKLNGKLNRPYLSAFDIGLELLRKFKVIGGQGKIFEYAGEGIKDLSVTERSTITNIGAELGATSSVFPSDERTKHFLKAQNREKDWVEIKADNNSKYSKIIEIDLSKIEPLIAMPDSPDNVVEVKKLKGKKINQVCIGSCTNSSYQVMQVVADILKGKLVHKNLSMSLSPGSRQVMEMMSKKGELENLISAGVRILECACGPCIGMGCVPASDSVSIRTFNRNFKGRAGTLSASVYLCSHITATISAITGELIDPRDAKIDVPFFEEVDKFLINDEFIIPPSKNPDKVIVIKGPNIKDVPLSPPLENNLSCEVLLKLKDNISTDDIMPASGNIIKYRSNIPEIAKYVFFNIDKNFYERAKKSRNGIIVAGRNYGQGSSREHAAIAPSFLGVKAIIAKSFARIHRSNLINAGIFPLFFSDFNDYEKINSGDIIGLRDIIKSINNKELVVTDKTKNKKIKLKSDLSTEEKEIIKSGGLFQYIKTYVKFIFAIFAILSHLILLCESVEAVPNENVAVIDFKPENVDSKIISDISERLREELKIKCNVTPENDMERILAEGGYEKGCWTTDCLVLAGNILNVDKIFTGNLAKVANIFVVEVKVVNIKEKKILLVKSQKCDNIKDIKEFIKSFILEEYAKQQLEVKKPEGFESVQTPTTLAEVKKYYGQESEYLETRFMFGIGGFGGYNYLVRGYNNYIDNFMFGGEFRLRLLSGEKIENLSYRLYLDYFPMNVPDGTYNLQEDIYNVNIGAIYGFLPNNSFNPFIGFGVGLYFDWVRFETPASGYLSNTYSFFGFNVSLGSEVSITEKISLSPESRINFIMEPGKPLFLARNISFHSTLIYYF